MEEIKKMRMPENLQKKTIFLSEFCNDHVKPVQKMVINGLEVCPRCEAEKANKKLSEEVSEYYNQVFKDEKYNTLQHKSILEDQSLLQASFDSYIAEDPEEKAREELQQNKKLVLECVERFKQGEVFNLILQGKQGTGKSHLSYATLNELNQSRQHSCLFIAVDAMLRKIKDSFNNKESKYTEAYFIDLLSNVDYLVLDDIGAETGAINSDKVATDFVQRVLYASGTVRQGKVTIITTNLNSATLYNMYDKKLISRLFSKPKYVVFKDSKDKRTSNIPF